MLLIIVGTFIILWLLGFLIHVGGVLIHVLFIIALIIFIYDLFMKRRR